MPDKETLDNFVITRRIAPQPSTPSLAPYRTASACYIFCQDEGVKVRCIPCALVIYDFGTYQYSFTRQCEPVGFRPRDLLASVLARISAVFFAEIKITEVPAIENMCACAGYGAKLGR